MYTPVYSAENINFKIPYRMYSIYALLYKHIQIIELKL